MDSNRLRGGYKVYEYEPPDRGGYRRIACQREMVEAIVKELQPDQPYVIRLGDWQQRYGFDERGPHVLYDFDVEIKKARAMDVVIPVYPDYESMRMMPLTVTAWEEIGRRIRNKVRFRGWFAPVADLFRWIEKTQGWA